MTRRQEASGPTEAALADVYLERERQGSLKASGKFDHTCADGELNNYERFMVLAEEFGEVGHELNEAIGVGRRLDTLKLRAELVQVAAVCVAWVEAIDGGRAQ